MIVTQLTREQGRGLLVVDYGAPQGQGQVKDAKQGGVAHRVSLSSRTRE
jgi:hypothetical protein